MREEPGPVRQAFAGALSVSVWITWAGLVILWTPLVALTAAATAWRDPARLAAGRLFRRCAALAVRVNPFWRVRVIGDPPARETHPLVFVCNHESLADVVVVGAMPWEMKWLSKEAVFRIPFQGWMMRMVRDVPVRRSDPESRERSYEELKKRIALGASVMIFPEGTRSRTDELLPFRNGAFRLAIETGTPILPMAVSGTREALRRGSLRFGSADIRVHILEPISVAGLREEDVEALRDRVRALIDAVRRGQDARHVRGEPGQRGPVPDGRGQRAGGAPTGPGSAGARAGGAGTSPPAPGA